MFLYCRYTENGGSNDLMGPSALVVPFVACGDLSGYDADKSYPLDLREDQRCNKQLDQSNNNSSSSNKDDADYVYQYRTPVQPPIHPNYHTYQQRVQNNSLNNKKIILTTSTVKNNEV